MSKPICIDSALDSHNIKLSEYLRCSKHLEPIRSRFAIVSEINNDLVERSTVLQVRNATYVIM